MQTRDAPAVAGEGLVVVRLGRVRQAGPLVPGTSIRTHGAVAVRRAGSAPGLGIDIRLPFVILEIGGVELQFVSRVVAEPVPSLLPGPRSPTSSRPLPRARRRRRLHRPPR